MKTALITGITGQDGAYLAHYLLEKGYRVHGIVRRHSYIREEYPRLDLLGITNSVKLHPGDITDSTSIFRIIDSIGPDEIYNLAAQSFVYASWDQPVLTAEATGLGALKVLEAIRKSSTPIRFFQASSSEVFGKVRGIPQNEETPFYPRSPYGVSKAFAHYATVNYRESYNIFACCGISFNHESPLRGQEFVTQKIARGAARCKLGLDKELRLGNLDAKRDWGHAADFVRAYHLMLQNGEPRDYIVATGQQHSVREFCQLAFKVLDLNYENYVVQDPKFLRPAEVETLLGDPTRIRNELGWNTEYSFEQLVTEMVLNSYKVEQTHTE